MQWILCYTQTMKFVEIQKILPDVLLDIRYASTYNFVGEKIDGYIDPIAIGTIELVQALQEVQSVFLDAGYRIKIYDAYRPQKAVDHFYRWVQDPNDTKMKVYFYPHADKDSLFKDAYLIDKSGHSRGSTIDLTLFDENKGCDIDMGSPFDLFDPLSHPLHTTHLSQQQKANRLFLRETMMSHGFLPLESEWWHFTLKDEPYPSTYFDFNVEAEKTK